MSSWRSRAIPTGAAVSLLTPLVGAFGYRFFELPLDISLLLVVVGFLLVAMTVLGGSLALFLAWRKGQRSAWTDWGGVGMTLAFSLVLLAYLGLQLERALSLPSIHNITTDQLDPPQFTDVPALRGEGANPLAYDAEAIGPVQAGAYPELASLALSAPLPEVTDAALAVLEDMGLELVAEHRDGTPDEHVIEATATTFWFGFKDDVVIRVRRVDTGSLVDGRSVSRIGRGDLGANARRLETFLHALQSRFPH